MAKKILLTLLSFLILISTSYSATFTVTITSDAAPAAGGLPGELRWAITQANGAPGPDLIDFNIPGTGPFTIMPAAQLPALNDMSGGTHIDGTTQSGAVCGLPVSTIKPMIELKGILAGGAHGIWIQSNNNIITCLTINEFEFNGILIEGISEADGNTIDCCMIGTDTSGTLDQGNGTAGPSMSTFFAGVKIQNQPGGRAIDNLVTGCLISGNWCEGVWIQGPLDPGDVGWNRVEFSYIGTDINGTSAIPNDHEGVCITEGAHDNVIDGNLISGNSWDGVGIQGYNNFGYGNPILSQRNGVINNIIGLDVSAVNPLPNGYHGVALGEYGPPRPPATNQWGCAPDNQVRSNTIAYNGGDGVAVWEDPIDAVNCDKNLISQNSIYDNAELGIDLENDGVTLNDGPTDPDNRGNEEINFPVILSAVITAGVTTINGSYDPTANTIEVFKARVDPSGNGEGEVYLGLATLDGLGNWAFTTSLLNVGDYVTATAYDTANNTSEFCANMVVSAGSTDWNCTDNPPPGKTAGGSESENNDGCAIADTAICETAYCGDISPAGDEDWWVLKLPPNFCYCAHVRVFGNDTPGQYAYGGGLDPVLEIYANDCSTLLFSNDNHGGTFPDAVGNDAQYDCNDPGNCHQPNTQLYIRVTGIAGSEGPYLLVINCDTCPCPEPVDTCDYYKSGYLDYCPNGMPDFDQKQNGWFVGSAAAPKWTHCGPVALANCLWWFDSKFEPNPVDPRPFYPGPGNPAPNDNYPLVTSYEPAGGLWDDHDTNNVLPFVDSLALYCKTNTGIASGTYIDSLYIGAVGWLMKTGQNAYYTVNVYAVGEVPGYAMITPEELKVEVLRSQDVILLLGFYHMPDPPFCERIGGHYVTIAGTCDDPLDSAFCISDPMFDKNEGEPPIGASGHGPTDHNDASLVSGPHGTMHHDKYYYTPTMCGNIGSNLFLYELSNYGIDSTHAVPFQGINGGGTIPVLNQPILTIIEYALVICPIDTDEDGVPDLTDNCPLVPNPGQENDDTDTLGNACDNCPTVANNDQANSDGDSHGDACDNCDLTDNEDQANDDADTLGNACDNCPTADNNDQTNSDGDSHGDACDNCPTVDNESQTNSDGDSHGDACDNCDLEDNEDQADGDGDNVGNVCDNCVTTPNPLQTNSDSDTLGDACDNCPNDDNNDQANNDGDALGDVCDPDDDNDGINDDGDGSGTIGDNPCTGGEVDDCDDNCQFDSNPNQEDANSNGVGDICDGETCCIDKTGNADCEGPVEDPEQPDISDIVRIIDFLYLSHDPLCCLEEADVDASGPTDPLDPFSAVDISDIVYLIDHLYLSHKTLPDCP